VKNRPLADFATMPPRSGIALMKRSGSGSVSYRVALGTGLAVLSGMAQAEDKPPCKPAAFEAAQVRAVIDGRTLLLTDGREVRLAGIEVSQPSSGESAANAAKLALESLVSGRDVVLMRLGSDSDRYGRVVALVAVAPATGGSSVQQALLAQGHARVGANIADFACAASLLAAEKAARMAGLGLWADPYYVTPNAEDPAGILAVRGRFAVVEGKVLSVRESGGTIYVNFGRRWSDDFTVTVLKRHERSFTAAGMPLKKLAGQHVRVRGFVEERGGPWIEATAPAQIEIAERGHE
jgi:endonuclease YncB( thermonuclease family)